MSVTPEQRLQEALDGLMSAIEHLCRLPSWSVSPEVYKRAMMALQEATLARADLADALKLADLARKVQEVPSDG
ncbi:MAG: hypothetical protein QJR08_04200 [Bacillota bacterium]|nr:hypothetical protein [Bacillota bacterium]